AWCARRVVDESDEWSREFRHEEIAALVGSVREVVQRAVKTLEHAGFIQMARGRIRIIDVEALDGWSDSESSLFRSVSRQAAPSSHPVGNLAVTQRTPGR